MADDNAEGPVARGGDAARSLADDKAEEPFWPLRLQFRVQPCPIRLVQREGCHLIQLFVIVWFFGFGGRSEGGRAARLIEANEQKLQAMSIKSTY